MTVMIDPRRHQAVLFDLDGVLTDTAAVHAAAWKHLFDEYLARRPSQPGEDHRPFTGHDYRRYVDGRPRYDGVTSFLVSRGISLPRGVPDDPDDAETVSGIGNRKNRLFSERLEKAGVDVFGSTVGLVHRLHEVGVKTAVFSASRNCRRVLEAASLSDLFPVRVDGEDAAELGLPGKPDPAVLLEAARRLGADPARAVVVEDAEAGVEAGYRGGFALVIGVDRTGDPARLRDKGADVVVSDLSEVYVVETSRRLSEVPDALERWGELAGMVRNRVPAVFLGYDGALSRLVADRDEATRVEGALPALARLAKSCPVAVISGRSLADVEDRIDIGGVWYAGSHGFELRSPSGALHRYEDARADIAVLERAADEVERRVADVPGAAVENTWFAVAVRYHDVDDARVTEVLTAVEEISHDHPELRVARGRRVVELRRDLEWDKGRALHWALEWVAPGPALPIYVGDDLTDEDALDAVERTGLGIVVRSDEHGDRFTAAHVAVEDLYGLVRILELLSDELERAATAGR